MGSHFFFGGAVLASALFVTRVGAACGGIVAPPKAVVAQTDQRTFVSVRSNDTTNIVIQLALPSADVPFGAITPVSGKPTLDPTPIDVQELDTLDESTRPLIRPKPASGGCGCGSAAAGGVRDKGGVNVIQIVDIGPVTAAVLTATSQTDLSTWLAQNGFELPATAAPIVAQYLGTDRYFIAFKRNQAAPPGPSSVGVSFFVSGDQRGYALAMARVGAASSLGIQVFVAAPENLTPHGSAPLAPFSTLTLNNLDPAKLTSDYSGAVAAAVAKKGGKAFVVEGVFHSDSGWRSALGPGLTGITESGQILTRLSTVVSTDAIEQDVSFMGEAPANAPNEVTAGSAVPTPGRGGEELRLLSLTLFLCAAFARVLRRTLKLKVLRSAA